MLGFFFFFFGCKACGILVPQPGMERCAPPELRSLNSQLQSRSADQSASVETLKEFHISCKHRVNMAENLTQAVAVWVPELHTKLN